MLELHRQRIGESFFLTHSEPYIKKCFIPLDNPFKYLQVSPEAMLRHMSPEDEHELEEEQRMGHTIALYIGTLTG